MEIKKVSIIGCGALGMMYASHILKESPSHQIQFIADRGRLDRYRKSEFYVNDVRQSFHFVTPDADARYSDLVIFAVKFNHLREAVEAAKNHIGADTIILSFLNGISSEEIIGETYSPAKTLYSMVAGMDATRTGNTVHFTKTGYIAFGGPPHEHNSQDINSVAMFFDQVGLKYEVQKDIIKSMWWKYMLNIGINQTSALLRFTYGVFQTSSYAENVMRMAMYEVLEISHKLGIALNEDDITSCVEIIKTLSPNGKTSMLQDIEAGQVTEVDMFAGTLIELGKKYDVPTPVNMFLLNAIKSMESQF